MAFTSKFKNPLLYKQYKKPACSQIYCFNRYACCNNYRCCVCRCCLNGAPIYDEITDKCIARSINSTQIPTEKQQTPVEAKKLQRNASTVTSNGFVHNLSKGPSSKNTKHLLPTTPTTIRNKDDNKMKTNPILAKKHEITTVSFKAFPGPQGQGFRSTGNKDDDKTSIIAGVATALALVAVIAVLALVLLCSKKRREHKKKGKDVVEREKQPSVPSALISGHSTYRESDDPATSETTQDLSDHNYGNNEPFLLNMMTNHVLNNKLDQDPRYMQNGVGNHESTIPVHFTNGKSVDIDETNVSLLKKKVHKKRRSKHENGRIDNHRRKHNVESQRLCSDTVREHSSESNYPTKSSEKTNYVDTEVKKTCNGYAVSAVHDTYSEPLNECHKSFKRDLYAAEGCNGHISYRESAGMDSADCEKRFICEKIVV